MGNEYSLYFELYDRCFMLRFQFYLILITLIAINYSFCFPKDNSPEILGESNGYHYLYYLTFHPWLETDISSVEIFITCPVRTNAYLEIEDLNLFKKLEIRPNEIGKFELNAKEALVYSKSAGEPPKPEQIWTGRAIKIYSEFPVLMYGVYKSSPNSAEGFLILPVTSLGKEYQISSYTDPSNNTTNFSPSYTTIVGVYDNTQVQFRLGGCQSCKVPKENGDTLEFGEVISRKLNNGDVWLIPGVGSFTDLTGSKVSASKPVAVFSGNYNANVPSHLSSSNYLIEQENPTNIWGTKYYIAPIPERKKSSIIKIFAKYPNTDVTLDGVPMWNIKTSGGAFGEGYIETRAFTTDTIKPVIIQSINDSLPINVVQYNTSGDDDGVSSAPYQLNVSSTDVFNKKMTFFIPQISGIEDAYVNIIYKATNDGKIPDNLKIEIDTNGKRELLQLNKISSDPGKPFIADIPDSDGRIYYVKTMKLESNKLYSVLAKEPLMAYVYGNSYAFPAFFNSFFDAPTDTLAPTVTFTIGTNSVEGTVTDEPQDDPDEIRSNLGLVYMDNKSQNFEFEVDQFEIGITPSTKWRLKVIDTTDNAISYLIFIDRAGNRTDTSISIKASPYNLRIKDSLALVALYNSTNGNNWTNNSNWLTDKTMNEWFGVILDIGRVTSLKLSSNNLLGSIPDSIKNLSNLKVFWLHNNQLWGGLENLPNNIQRENLSIYSNRFDFADLARSSLAINENYSPQDSIGNPDSFKKNVGETLELSAGDEYYNGNVYQWFKDGVIINNQTAQKLEISALSLSDAGFYYCEAINPQFSELKLTSRKFKLNVIDPTSISDEIDYEYVKIYPNPAEDYIYLNYVNSINNISDLYIIDYLGNKILVKSDLINDNSIRINVSNLSKGVYFIKLRDNFYQFMKY